MGIISVFSTPGLVELVGQRVPRWAVAGLQEPARLASKGLRRLLETIAQPLVSADCGEL